LELRYGLDVADPWLRSFQLYGFVDFGAVWRIDGAAEDRRSLASAGLGARFNVLDDVSGSLEVARPLTATPQAEDDRGLRLFLTLVRRF
jgi:hemolysin activation/secretion protein